MILCVVPGTTGAMESSEPAISGVEAPLASPIVDLISPPWFSFNSTVLMMLVHLILHALFAWKFIVSSAAGAAADVRDFASSRLLLIVICIDGKVQYEYNGRVLL